MILAMRVHLSSLAAAVLVFVLVGCSGMVGGETADPAASACEKQFVAAVNEHAGNKKYGLKANSELLRTADKCADRAEWLSGFAAHPIPDGEAETVLASVCSIRTGVAPCAKKQTPSASKADSGPTATPTPSTPTAKPRPDKSTAKPTAKVRKPSGKGRIVEGPHYAVRVPRNWKTQNLGNGLVITVSPPGDASILVAEQPTPVFTLEELVPLARAELLSEGAQGITRQRNVMIDGHRALYFKSFLGDGDDVTPLQQYLVIIGSTLHIVTISTDSKKYPGLDQRLLDSLIFR